MAKRSRIAGWENTLIGFGLGLVCGLVGIYFVSKGLLIGWGFFILTAINWGRAWFDPINVQSRRMAKDPIHRSPRRVERED